MRKSMFIANGIILLTQFSVIFAALPPIKKCKLSDSQCIKTSAQSVVPIFTAGIPELGIEVLDPLKLNYIKVDLSGLKLDIKEVVITGFKNTIIDKLKVDIVKKNIQLVFHVDISMRGKYKASGQLIVLPISGDGDAYIPIKNCQIVMDMPFEISKNKDGKDVINLKSYKYSFDVRDNAMYELTNLFDGNKELSDNIHKFMNENWKLLSHEFGRPVFDKPIKKIYKSMKTFLSSQPLEEITNV